MARKIQSNPEVERPEGEGEHRFAVEMMNVEQSMTENGDDSIVVIFTCSPQQPDESQVQIRKYFIPFHGTSPYPRRIWRYFARGMGAVGHAPTGETVTEMVVASENWLMPDAVKCEEDGTDQHGNTRWKVCDYDWGEPAGEAQLYEPPRASYEPAPAPAHDPPPAQGQHGDTMPPPPDDSDLPF